MFGSNFIELGIAVSFLFILLSLMCSLLGEMVSKYLSWRSEMLEESIEQLLRDRGLAAYFYKHPLIKSMSRDVRAFDKARRLDAISGPRWPRSWFAWVNRKLDLVSKPSYIKSTNFARATLDVLVLLPRLEALKALRAKIPGIKEFKEPGDREALLRRINEAEFDTVEEFHDAIVAIGVFIEDSVIKEGERAKLLECIEELKKELEPPAEAAEASAEGGPSKELVEVRVALKKLDNPELRRIFQSLINGDKVKDRAHAELLVARYYDDVQERVSGWYKRRAQRWVFGIGLGLALILNANTFIIADKLLRDNTIRALVVAAADGSGDRFRPAPATASAESVTPAASSGAPAAASPAAPTAGSSDSQGAPVSAVTLQELKQEIEKLSLPIGWPERPLMVATPVISSVAACALVAPLLLAPAEPAAPQRIASLPNSHRVQEEMTKRVELAEKDAKALAEYASNPRGCPDFVCGDRKWGTQWPYYLKKSVLWLLKMIVGWLVTALGAAMGAQFWFDVIGSITRIRASKRPEDAPSTVK